VEEEKLLEPEEEAVPPPLPDLALLESKGLKKAENDPDPAVLEVAGTLIV